MEITRNLASQHRLSVVSVLTCPVAFTSSPDPLFDAYIGPRAHVTRQSARATYSILDKRGPLLCSYKLCCCCWRVGLPANASKPVRMACAAIEIVQHDHVWDEPTWQSNLLTMLYARASRACNTHTPVRAPSTATALSYRRRRLKTRRWLDVSNSAV